MFKSCFFFFPNVRACDNHRLAARFWFDELHTCRFQIPSVCRRSEYSLIVVEMVFPHSPRSSIFQGDSTSTFASPATTPIVTLSPGKV